MKCPFRIKTIELVTSNTKETTQFFEECLEEDCPCSIKKYETRRRENGGYEQVVVGISCSKCKGN